MSDLDRALDLLLAHEGGWSNHVADRGGATMYGVTQAAYDNWRRKGGVATQPVRMITKGECRRLYDECYWTEAGCDKLPWPLSYIVFDAAVNSGPSRSIKWLQQGLGVDADGIIGKRTIAAAQKVVADGDAGKILAIVRSRADFIADVVKANKTQAVFLKGWSRRILDVLARGLVDLVNA